MLELPALKQTIGLLLKSKNILLLTHKKVDGDGLASITALYLLLKKLGKNVTAVCEDPVPEVLKFLPGSDNLHTGLNGLKDFVVSIRCPDVEVDNLRYTIEEDRINIFISPKKGTIAKKDVDLLQGYHRYEAVVVLDAPDYESLGNLYSQHVELFYQIPVINLDHHVNNTYFGKINMVDLTAASTTEMIVHLLPHLSGTPLIDEDIATLLLAGIITDTGSFQNSNTTPRAFATAAKLVQQGARQQEIIKHIYKTKQLSTLKLWGQVLSNVKTNPVYRLVWSALAWKETSHLGKLQEDDLLSLIDSLLSNAPGAEIILLLAEGTLEQTKGYIRTTTPSIDAGKIARLFHGQGTYHNGSFTIPQSLAMCEPLILEQITSWQAKRLGINMGTSTLPTQEEKFPSLPSKKETIDIPVVASQDVEETITASFVDQLKNSGQPQEIPKGSQQ